ncbi:MAG TPA: tyrosine-type recombinase/integrase [Abditibacteriaceae bacterium]|jgi:site-specific recombinase XerD
MLETAPVFSKLPLTDIEEMASLWLRSGERRGQSPRTIECKKDFTEKFLWFLKHKEFEAVGAPEIEEFLHYLQVGHREPGGRWGNPQMTRPLRPVSICDYYRYCRGLFSWAYKKGYISCSPMERIEPPLARSEVKQALSAEQVDRLISVARRSENPARDVAIITLLYDTGIRASELINLKVGDIDLKNGRFMVQGKGNKLRPVFFQEETAEALLLYRNKARRRDDQPLFVAEGGKGKGKALTRSGLLQLVQRLGAQAGFSVTVHQLRRTFATHILRNGATLNGVRDMLGHSSIKMTLVYCSLAEADIENQHRQYSPAARLKK